MEKEEAASPEHVPGKPPVFLTNDAFKRVLTVFSKKMETEFYHPLAERKMTYNQALVFQARQYRRLIEGEIERYTPLTLR